MDLVVTFATLAKVVRLEVVRSLREAIEVGQILCRAVISPLETSIDFRGDLRAPKAQLSADLMMSR